jgi:hypothetical protein
MRLVTQSNYICFDNDTRERMYSYYKFSKTRSLVLVGFVKINIKTPDSSTTAGILKR